MPAHRLGSLRSPSRHLSLLTPVTTPSSRPSRPAAAAPDDRPNIVLITTDDQTTST